MSDEFGQGYAGSLAHDQVLAAVGGRTAIQALEAGESPRAVWEAVCETMDVPPERRLGHDRRPTKGGHRSG